MSRLAAFFFALMPPASGVLNVFKATELLARSTFKPVGSTASYGGSGGCGGAARRSFSCAAG
jgi:hypothetical protein